MLANDFLIPEMYIPIEAKIASYVFAYACVASGSRGLKP